ncbi:MAG TPA: DUF4142 domain-containing protein, partial [Vitreimonas sp.]|nr:DUF4142 domain-containing protein [Vitreimonas sp.]
MRTWLGVIFVCATLGACGQAPTQAAPQHPRPTWATTPDGAFFRAAAVYETYQIQAAHIAQASAQSPAVKAYAASAEAEHRDARRSLTALALQYGLPTPTDDLNADYRGYIDR